jgi:hypothetical protein
LVENKQCRIMWKNLEKFTVRKEVQGRKCEGGSTRKHAEGSVRNEACVRKEAHVRKEA